VRIAGARVRVATVIVCVLGAWFGAGALAADLAAVPEITPDAIQQRIDQITAADDIPQSIKEQLLAEYAKALEAAEEAGKQEAEAARFEQARNDAPGQLAQLKRQLSQEATPPQVAAPEASAAELEQSLLQAEAALSAARKKLGDLEAEQTRRAGRRAAVPLLEASARERLAAVNARLEEPPGPGPAELAAARTAVLRAQKAALEAELERYRQELLSYQVRGDLLRARRDVAMRELSQAQATAEQWRRLVQAKQRQEALETAQAAAASADDAPQAVRDIAKRNEELALILAGDLSGRMAEAAGKLDRIQEQRDRLAADLRDVRTKVAQAGLTRAMGAFLRKKRTDLPDASLLERDLAAVQRSMSDVQVRLLEFTAEREALANLDAAVLKSLAGMRAITAAQRADLKGTVRDLLESRYELLSDLVRRYDSYFGTLVDLARAQEQLIATVRDYAGFIDANILWFRSSAPLGPQDVPRALAAARWFLQPGNWAALLRAVASDAGAVPLFYAAALLLTATLLALRPRFRAGLRRATELASGIETDAIRHTLTALALTALLSVPWPLLAAFAAWRLTVAADPTGFSKVIGAGLQALAVALLTMDFPRKMCMQGGLAEGHFRWRSRPVQVFRRNLSWALPIVLPAAFLAGAFRAQQNELWADSLGRLSLMAVFVLSAAFIQRVLRFRGGIAQEALARHREGWLNRLRYFWYLPAVAMPLVLAAAAAFGYYYTALVLGARLVRTAWMLLGLLVVYELMMRWLFVARRRLAQEQARKRRAAARAERVEQEPGEAGPLVLEEQELSIHSISAQTRQLVQSVIWFSVLLLLWLVWSDVLPALGKLGGLKLETGIPITLGAVGLAVLTLAVTVLAAKNIPGLLEIALLQHLPIEGAVRFAITTVSRYAIVLVGIVLSFNALGIPWEKVQWLAAAVTVGLGFGLQEIFANFVSGLIILFERPMRVGDTVTVGDITGTVSRIRIRATTIVDWDRKELVVPNKEFITGRLINWTLSDRILRVVIPVGIAYGSDTELARRTLLRVAKENQTVLDEPEPTVFFLGFGDSALNFEVRVFVPTVEVFLTTRHELHMAIDKAFREAGIEISFPQQDVHIRSIQAALPLELPAEGGSENG